MKRGFPDKVKHSSAYGSIHHGNGNPEPFPTVMQTKQSEAKRPSLALMLNSSAANKIPAGSSDFVFLNTPDSTYSPLDYHRYRRARTSAAMVGLALSVGAMDILSGLHAKSAFANELEPTAEPLHNWSDEENFIFTPSLVELSSIAPPKVDANEVSFSLAPGAESTFPTFELADYYPHELLNHQVVESETLWTIAQKYGVEPEVLAHLNHLSTDSPLQVGQILQLPRVFITRDAAFQSQAPTVNDAIASSASTKVLDKSSLAEESLKGGIENPGLSSTPTRESSEVTIALDLQPVAKEDSPMPVAFLPAQPVGLSDLMLYRVQPGDTLAKIARVHHVSSATLVAVNQIDNPNLLKVDQIIGVPRTELNLSLVPVESRSEAEAIAPVVNSLRAGQGQAESTVQEPAPPVTQELASVLQQDIAFPYEPNNLFSGELSYQVQRGDTLTQIARRYEIPVAEIIRVNQLTNPNLIKVDQTLTIPTRGSQSALLPVQDSVQIASRSIEAGSFLNQPEPEQVVQNQVEVPATPGTFQVNTAIIPTVPSLQAVVQDGIALPQPQSPAVVEPEVPTVAIAAPTSAQPFNPAAGVVLPAEPTEDAQPAQSTSKNDYVSQLLSEVKALRDQYRAGQKTLDASTSAIGSEAQGIAATNTTSTIPTVITPVASNSDRINPEFNAKAYGISPEAPSFETSALSSGSNEFFQPMAQENAPQILAAAPIGSSQYEPLVQSLMGQTVSPALPTLGSDPYLPQDQTFAGYIWPAQGVLTSGYGWRWGRMHKGIDIAGPIGTPIVSAAPGVVITAGWNSGGYGNLVEIQHEDGSITLYAHNNRILVREGQYVQQGQQLAEMGSTGYSTGPHLHFEIHPAGDGAVNPMAYLPQ